MKTYILTQIIVTSVVQKGNSQDHLVDCIVRRVEAESEEIAIGKFVLATQKISVIKKLNIECYDITEITTLN